MRYPLTIDLLTPANMRTFQAHAKLLGSKAAAGQALAAAGMAALSAPPAPPAAPAKKKAKKKKA